MRLKKILQKADAKTYTMELIIVILGISIAFQLQIFNENRTARQLEINSLQNLKKEIEINIQEFESLRDYRKRITNASVQLMDQLQVQGSLPKEFAEQHLFYLVQTSTPDLQKQATQSYLENNQTNTNIDLKNELLLLQTLFQEFQDMSEGYKERKSSLFFSYLLDDVDFPSKKIVSVSRLNTVRFKNILWNQTTDEYGLNRLYDQAETQLKKVDSLITISLN